MIDNSLFLSAVVLLISCLVLLYAVLAFAHVRITDGDMAELERLRKEGVLPAEARPIEDFQLIHAKLNEIAPAVCLRQELWLHLYFHILRLTCWWQLHSERRTILRAGALERELQRLNAYQAGHYRVAMQRLDALRNPTL